MSTISTTLVSLLSRSTTVFMLTDTIVFLSPLPNPQLWIGGTIGFLQAYESFANGGWWHDPNLLAATGDGLKKEEPRGWRGWWNEQIVRLPGTSVLAYRLADLD